MPGAPRCRCSWCSLPASSSPGTSPAWHALPLERGSNFEGKEGERGQQGVPERWGCAGPPRQEPSRCRLWLPAAPVMPVAPGGRLEETQRCRPQSPPKVSPVWGKLKQRGAAGSPRALPALLVPRDGAAQSRGVPTRPHGGPGAAARWGHLPVPGPPARAGGDISAPAFCPSRRGAFHQPLLLLQQRRGGSGRALCPPHPISPRPPPPPARRRGPRAPPA